MGTYLSEPNKEKDSESEVGEKMNYAACSMQGWRKE